MKWECTYYGASMRHHLKCATMVVARISFPDKNTHLHQLVMAILIATFTETMNTCVRMEANRQVKGVGVELDVYVGGEMGCPCLSCVLVLVHSTLPHLPAGLPARRTRT